MILTAALSTLDIGVIAGYLLAMAAIGFWFMHRNRSADDYFKGGGKLPWWAVSLSIYATMFSSITFLSIPALVYKSDMCYFAISFGIVILAPVVVKWYLPFFRRLNLTSAYEYLEVRFNLPCRLFASAAFTCFMVARTAVVTYLPAIAIAAVTDMDVNTAIVAVTLVTIVYCTVGGVEAVIWSDFVQSLLLIASTVLILATLIAGTDGGFVGFVRMGSEAGKFRVFDLALDFTKPTFWVVFTGGVVANLASYTSDQCVVQRYMTTRDERSAAKSIMFNGALSLVNCFVFFVMGVALWTFYQSHPDLLPNIAKNDQILPAYIANELPHGVSGLVLAAVAAATMSTLSSNLNSAATALTTDFYKRLVLAGRPGREDDGRRLLLCGKVCTVLTGLLGGGFALVLANMEIFSIYDQFQRFLGVLTAGLGCLFFMGVFMKRVNGFGATCGLVANYVVAIGLDQIPFDGKPHMLLYGTIGMLACLVVAPLASRLGGAKKL
jgi:SSS family transporter